MTDTPMQAIREAGPADWQTLGRILGPAFEHDPVASWVFGDARVIEAGFARLARDVYLPRGVCLLAGDAGAAMWLSPGRSNALGLLQTVAAGTQLLRMAGARVVLRALAVDRGMQAHHPAPPHFYLFTVGVLAHARGHGLARKLLSPVLARCDVEGLPAYLENSREQNCSLYEGLGFVRGPSFSPARGCPPLMPMWREPRPR